MNSMYTNSGPMQRPLFICCQESTVISCSFPRLDAPIVLVHGLCGFDRLYAMRRPVADYFPGIREYLEAAGNRVYTARVSPTSGVARRALDLKRFIEREVPAGPVHIIGHSMGGLDARYMISRLGMEHRVRSLITIGTPHRGSTFADWGWHRLSRFLVPVMRWLGIPHQAFIDLRTDSCRRFNEDVPNVPGVRYLSVAGVCERPWIGPEWELPFRVVNRREGPNDGVVSVASAAWGEHCEVWPGDHLNLVNWPNRIAVRRGLWRDRAADYGRILQRLAYDPRTACRTREYNLTPVQSSRRIQHEQSRPSNFSLSSVWSCQYHGQSVAR
jgi:triacylglycerol lipase